MKPIVLFFITFLLCITHLKAQKVKYKKLGIEKKSLENIYPLAINDTAPDFELTINQEKILLSEYVKVQPVVLVFYRGHWCPICNRHLAAFQEDLYMLKEKGLSAIAIAPQTEEYINKTIEKTGLEIPVVSDVGGKIMHDYNVAFEVRDRYERKISTFLFSDIADSNGEEEAYLPVPATYVVDENMKVTYVHFDLDYSERASVKDIIEGLK